MNFFIRVIDGNSIHIIINIPNTLKEFKNYLQFLTPLEQITEINHAIHDILIHKKQTIILTRNISY